MVDSTLANVRAIAAESDAGRANEIAVAALRQGLRHPAFHAARARWLRLNGRNADALDELRQALALAPRDLELLQEFGITLLKLNRPANAIAVFDMAIRISPANAQTHYLKGCACSAAGDPAAALRSHERAIALEPRHADALAAAAATRARAGEMVKSRRLAERALRVSPANPTAAIALAMCDLHDREFARAEQHMDSLLSEHPAQDETRALALGLLGDALDGEERTTAAFKAYAEKNNILADINKQHFDGETRFLNRVERLMTQLQQTAPSVSDPRMPENSPPRRHVFLLGFMRSGTTLLEQILASHGDVETLEERETLAGLYPGYFGGAVDPGGVCLPSGDELEQARETYWNRVRSFGAKPEGKIFLEKQPFNTVYLPLIARLFPSAKIVFQLRDPRDVILSCFRRHLEIKPTTFELLTLGGAAIFYDRVMQFAELCRSRLPIDLFDCRYENLVSDFEMSVGEVCHHLDIEWADFDARFR